MEDDVEQFDDDGADEPLGVEEGKVESIKVGSRSRGEDAAAVMQAKMEELARR